MSTTTIRLPEDLKARVAAAAERAGTTAHGFILEAIAEKADQAERRADFHDVAQKRYADLVASGKMIPWKKCAAISKIESRGKPWLARWPRNWLPEEQIDTVFVLAIRSQREAGYSRT
jgi:predicted transcriptional regulator